MVAPIHPEQIEQFLELLRKWNARINLTSVADDALWSTHVEDALHVLPHIALGARLIDLGTGAGLPGVILKIERPDLDVTLLDATRKKVSFCDEVIRRIGLSGIQTVCARAEDKKASESVGIFDTVISRATWALKEYLWMASRFVRPNGQIIAMKGPKWQEELSDAGATQASLRASLERVHEYSLFSGEQRCLLLFRNNDKPL